MDERRNFRRVPFATRAEINCSGEKYHGELIDISLKGALVEGKGAIPLSKGNRCELAIHLLNSEITMHFEADIIHRQEDRFGFHFIGLDTESASHLRRLLEFNIGSSEALELEVAFWLKEK